MQNSQTSDQDEIESFLSRLNTHRLLARPIRYANRQKNVQALLALDIRAVDRDQVVFALRLSNYSHTIRDSTGDLLVFGDSLSGVTIYIKLVDHDRYVECVSFHPAEHSLDFPYA